MNRNVWILAGVAGAAFLIFLLLGGGGSFSSPAGGSGFIGLFRGGREEVRRGLAARDAGRGEVAPGAPAAAGGRWPGAGRSTQRKAKNGVPAADPDLVKRMQAGGSNLVPVGPASSPRAGLVQQTFRGNARSSKPDGPVPGGPEGPGEPPDVPGSPQDPNNCGAPKVRKMVVDLQVNSLMRAAFDVPSNGFMIRNGMGERFNIGNAPAYLILSPWTKRMSAGAIFDDRFLVLLQGECIPDRKYVKALLRR